MPHPALIHQQHVQSQPPDAGQNVSYDVHKILRVRYGDRADHILIPAGKDLQQRFADGNPWRARARAPLASTKRRRRDQGKLPSISGPGPL